VQSAIDEGAEVICGAKRPDGFVKGFYYEPTVLVGTNEMRIAQKEIFGPVMTVILYSGEDCDAVRIANDSVYGLGGGVAAASTSRAFNVARQVRAGHMNAQGVGNSPLPSPGPLPTARAQGWGQSKSGIGQTGAFGSSKQRVSAASVAAKASRLSRN
jgi:acyl-CoA reductase-like NAD-dependent aldehyde dehydrogenase